MRRIIIYLEFLEVELTFTERTGGDWTKDKSSNGKDFPPKIVSTDEVVKTLKKYGLELPTESRVFEVKEEDSEKVRLRATDRESGFRG